MNDFPYKQFIIYPGPLVISRTRDRLCISKEHLDFVREAMPNCSFRRRARPFASELCHPKSRVDDIAVLAEKIGYIVVKQGRAPSILASMPGEIPLAFPTLDDAMLFAEAKFLDLPQAGLAYWVPASGKL